MSLTHAQILDKHAIQGKIDITPKVTITSKADLAVYYTPGVAVPCLEIQKNPALAYTYTRKANTIAIVSDGTAVLGLGNIGGIAGMPVMEGKSLLMRQFGQINCVPIVLNTQDPERIIQTVDAISPGFGGIILEDIAAPQCFHIEQTLRDKLNIPVFHDDQHGTAIVILAGLINALKLTNKSPDAIKVVIAGAGAGGIATGKLLAEYGITHIIFTDSKGTINGRRTDLHVSKQSVVHYNKHNVVGSLTDAIAGADVFIGLSGQKDLLTPAHIASMNTDPIIFTASNPNPEIDPELAASSGAYIIATGRSDFPNQLNNLLIFPGLFRGLLAHKATGIPDGLMISLAQTLADSVSQPKKDHIIPDAIDPAVHECIYTATCAYISKLDK